MIHKPQYTKKRKLLISSVLIFSLATAGCSQADSTPVNTEDSVQLSNLSLTIPDTFKESTTSGLYLTDSYPEDQSNIYLHTSDKVDHFLDTMAGGQEEFLQNLVTSYEAQYEETVDITTVRYEYQQVAGLDAYVVELTYTLADISYHQLEYIIDAKQTCYIAFSQIGTYDWMQTFIDTAATISPVSTDSTGLPDLPPSS